MSSPRAPPPRSGKRAQRGGRGGATTSKGDNSRAASQAQIDSSSKETNATFTTASSASPHSNVQVDPGESSSLTEMPAKSSRAGKTSDRRAARRASNRSSTTTSPKAESSPAQNQAQNENDSLSPSNSRGAMTPSPNSNGFHSSPPSPQPSPSSDPQAQPASTTIGAFGGWLSNRIMGGTPSSPGNEEGKDEEATGEEEQTQTKMRRSDSVSMASEAGESSAAYSASEVDGFEDAEDGDEEESVVGEPVEIEKAHEKLASGEVSTSSVDEMEHGDPEVASGENHSPSKDEEDPSVEQQIDLEQSKNEIEQVSAIPEPSTLNTDQVSQPQTPPPAAELQSETALQSTPSNGHTQRESTSEISISSSAPSVSASTSNSPSANSTSVDESVKSPDLTESAFTTSDSLKTPMQPRTLLHQATPLNTREEDLPIRLSEEGPVRESITLENTQRSPPSKPSSLASVDIKDRISFDESKREELDRNPDQSSSESMQRHRDSDASSQRSISQAGSMLSPSLNVSGQVSPGGTATSPGGTKRSFWGLLRSPSNSPAAPGSAVPFGRGVGNQRAFSLSSEGGGSGSESGNSLGQGLSPTTPVASGSTREISPITTSTTSNISGARVNRTPSFSPMSSFSSFAASISAARVAALGSTAAVALPTSDSKPKARLPRRRVDEMKIAEDAMRFIDARDILHSEKDSTKIRELAKRLEEGWREKLHEVSALRSQVEEASDLQDDLQDENDALRTQLGSLSNTIASREEEFENFQKSVVEQQARERLLWDQEAKEERENVMHLVKEASTKETKLKAVNSQLRLILINALQGRVDGLKGLRQGMTGMGPPSPVPSRTEFENPDQSLDIDDQERQDRRASAARLLTASSELKFGSARRNSRRQTTTPGGEGGEDDDLLFAMSMSPTESRPSTTLFNEPLPFQTLRELGLIPLERDVQELEQDENGESQVDRNRLSIPISELPMSQLVAEKHAADNSLVLAIQEENKSLRTLAEQRAGKNVRLEEEVEQLRTRLAQTEAAISEMFNDVSIANRE